MQKILQRKYPAIKAKRKSGTEQFLNAGASKHTLADFWSWAYSDLIGNTERGKLAEYIVAMALCITESISESWGKYDLISVEGIRIEVKSAAYIQTWEQDRLSRITFGIQPTYGWDSISNVYDVEKKRQSDVYVFCILKNKNQDKIDPLDISQWEFFVCSTETLNEKVPKQKSITIEKLSNIEAKKCDFDTLL